MTPLQRAFEILYREFGSNMSRDAFRVLLEDESPHGRYLRRFRDAVARGIEEDRRSIRSANAPS